MESTIDLRKKVDFNIESNLGIGHTRWATHGVPNISNAHPHQSSSKRFTLVHNGVIENYKELREQYLGNIELNSETDTEIIVELVDYFAHSEKLNTLDSFSKVLKLLNGSYAIAMIDENEPKQIYAAKNRSPLLIGKGNDFNTIVSDAMASISYTDTYLEISDKELVILSDKEIKIYDLDQNIIQRDTFKANIDVSDLEKGIYPHYMLKEIEEQPNVIRKISENYIIGNDQLSIDDKLLKSIKSSDRIFIIAAGTSMHAGLVGKSMIEQISNIPTEVHLSSEFSYNTPLLPEKPFFVFISQSGETADSRQVLVKIKNLGFESLTITNVKGSTLSREADYTLLLHAGPEIAVASTKAYTAQISVLYLLANALKTDYNLSIIREELSLVSNGMESIIDNKNKLHDISKDLFTNKQSAFYIGRGLDYFVSMEASLKLKEISYIQTEGFAAGELKHGTIALIEDETPVIGLISQKNTSYQTRSNLEEVNARGANVAIISTQDCANPEDDLMIPAVNELLKPLLMVIPVQYIAYYTTLDRGLDIDKPRNLAKSVTVE